MIVYRSNGELTDVNSTWSYETNIKRSNAHCRFNYWSVKSHKSVKS